MTDKTEFEFEDEIFFEEATTPLQAVNMANYALSTLDMIDMDDEKLTDTGKRTLMRVKKQCIKLLSWGVQEMHDSIFESDNDNN